MICLHALNYFQNIAVSIARSTLLQHTMSESLAPGKLVRRLQSARSRVIRGQQQRSDIPSNKYWYLTSARHDLQPPLLVKLTLGTHACQPLRDSMPGCLVFECNSNMLASTNEERRASTTITKLGKDLSDRVQSCRTSFDGLLLADTRYPQSEPTSLHLQVIRRNSPRLSCRVFSDRLELPPIFTFFR